MKFPIGIILLAFPVIGALSGCAPTFESVAPSRYQREIDLARKLSEEGDHLAAARIYGRLAKKTTPPDSDGFRYLAAESLYRSGDIQAARNLADKTDPHNLSFEDHYRLDLLYGRIFLAEKNPEKALRQLERLPAAKLSSELQLDYHSQRAQVFSALGNHLESARERILAEQLITDPKAIETSQIAILTELARLPEASLTQRLPAQEITLRGWLALTQIFKQAKPGTRAFDQRVQEWQSEYPAHPANLPVLVSNAGLDQELFKPPDTIGVLLPLSGPYAQVGEAIRQGILIAQKYSAAPPIPTRFYNSDLADPVGLYRRAIADGANMIIGPLQKDMLKSLASRNPLSVPVLGLNQVPELDVPNLYQFGLNPEDEVDQAAHSAWFDGYHRALIFSPATSQGRRLASHFSRKWQELGGEILRSVTYNPESTDYDEAIKQLLNVSGDAPVEKEEPLAATSNHLGSDFIFLVAQPSQARLIKPLFQYYNPDNLQVYGTSQVYAGHENPTEDQELSGIVFCDIPWLFGTAIEHTPALQAVATNWQHPATQYARLMALGFDAYNLLPHLSTLESDPEQSYPGTTGSLSIKEGRRIRRQLVCAEFQNGIPVPRSLIPDSEQDPRNASPEPSWSE